MAPLPFVLLVRALVVSDTLAVGPPKETNDLATGTVEPRHESHSQLMRAERGAGTRIIISAGAEVEDFTETKAASMLRDGSATATATATTTQAPPVAANYTWGWGACEISSHPEQHSASCTKAPAGKESECLHDCKSLPWFECTAAQWQDSPNGTVCMLFVDSAVYHECPTGYAESDATDNFPHPHVAKWVVNSSACGSPSGFFYGLLFSNCVCYVEDNPLIRTSQWQGAWKWAYTTNNGTSFSDTGNCSRTSSSPDAFATSTAGGESELVTTHAECKHKCVNEANLCNAIDVRYNQNGTLTCRYFHCVNVTTPTYDTSAVTDTRVGYTYTTDANAAP